MRRVAATAGRRSARGRVAHRPGAVLSAAVLVSVLASACTEQPLSEVDPTRAPGQATPTVELEIPVSELPAWRDTTFVGYAIPSSSSFRVLADSSSLLARLPGRFENLPDSVTVEEISGEVERFLNATFRIRLDTLDTVVPESGVDVEVYSLTRSYAEREATWTLAATGEPWTEPGGDLGPLLGSARLDAADTTLFVPVSVDGDSLLKAWRANGGEPGFLIRAVGPGTWLDVTAIALTFDSEVAGIDSLVAGARTPAGGTILFDPETPPPGTSLRLGALPAARVYASFDLPDEWDGVPLRGSTINRAELVLRPSAPEPEPFALQFALGGFGLQLLADPFEIGPKTPVGAALSSGSVLFDPESLEEDGELVIPITPLVLVWSLADPADAPGLWIAVLADPEGLGIGYQTFGSIEGPAGLQPSIRMLVTPRVPFRLP